MQGDRSGEIPGVLRQDAEGTQDHIRGGSQGRHISGGVGEGGNKDFYELNVK